MHCGLNEPEIKFKNGCFFKFTQGTATAFHETAKSYKYSCIH